MPATVTCPNPACARRSTVPDAAVGRAVRCPACGTRFAATGTRSADGATAAQPTGGGEPAVVGRFVVRERLGAGAFGTVYRAYDPQLDREVALKVPNAGVFDSPQRVERFLREARAAANLTHPHIVPVYDAGRDGDRYYIASAFVDGTPLADAIGDGKTDFRRAARLCRELAEALAYAHDKGVVHRDVKPANAMLDRADRLYLMDFGLAARAEDTAEARLTNDGAVLGTPAYMAPEQAAGQRGEARPESDQYAAGVVLYELLTGHAPFAGPPAVVLFNVLNTAPEPVAGLRPDVPKDLDTICRKAMAKRPEDRYPDCRGLADDLRRWLTGEPIAARRLSAAEQFARWVRRNRAVAALAAAVAASLLLGAVVSAVLAVNAAAHAARADAEAKAARDAEGRATEAAAEAARTAAAERTARANAEWVGYVDQIARANAVLAADPAQAAAILGRTKPDLRGWEYHYLRQAVGRGSLDLPAGRVVAATFSPGGGRVYTAADDRRVRAWDAVTGREVPGGGPCKGAVLRVVVDAAGARVVTLTDDGTLRLEDPAAGRVLFECRHPSTVLGVALSPDGTRLATAALDGHARVWAAGADKPVFDFPGRPALGTWVGRVEVAFSPDGAALLAGGAADGTPLRLWGLRDGKARVDRHVEGMCRSVAVSPDGTRLAAAIGVAEGELVQVLDASTGNPLTTLAGNRSFVRSVTFSPDGRWVAAAGTDGAARVWEARSGRLVRTFAHPDGPVESAAFSADGYRLLTTAGGAVRVWDCRGGDTGVLSGPARGAGLLVNAVAVTPDGSLVAAGESQLLNGVRVWDTRTRREAANLTNPSNVFAVAFSPDGKRLAFGDGVGDVELRDTAGWRPVWRTRAHRKPAYALAFRPDGRVLGSAGGDGLVHTLDAETGRNIRTFGTDTGVLLRTACAFSPDGRWLAGRGRAAPLRVWDADTGAPRLEVFGKGPVVTSTTGVGAAFDPGGALLITSDGPNVQVLDAATGAVRHTLTGHGREVVNAAFHPTAPRLASASSDGTARLWDSGKGQEVIVLNGHRNAVTALAFDADGGRLYTGSADGTVRVWDGRAAGSFDPWAEDGARRKAWEEDWHAEDAAAAERDGDEFAAVTHLTWLVARRPGDAGLRRRLDRATQRLPR